VPLRGAQFSTGRDLNDDGVLEDDEVRSVSYTCSDPAPTLTRDRVLDSSLTCPAGGIATESGVDDDRDGILEDHEIDLTAIRCNSLDHWAGDFTVEDWSGNRCGVAALRVRTSSTARSRSRRPARSSSPRSRSSTASWVCAAR